MEVSCAFPTALDSPDNIALAERMGYDRAWVYDTPQQSPDVWMTLALAAERTERIGLGPGVLVPSLRHPMVNAAATATLAALAPGRVAISFGTGFTGRRAMGYRADPVVVHGGLHPGVPRAAARRGRRVGGRADADAAPRRPRPGRGPSTCPSSSARSGPKGDEVARELGDGLYVTLQLPEFVSAYSWVPYLAWGTVLDDGEATDSDHARAAGGPGWALAYHGAYEFGGPTPSAISPAAREWMDVVERTPADQRHLAVHVGHCVELNEADRAAWDAGGHAMLRDVTLSGTPDEIRDRLDELAAHGVTEIVFQPCGPDVAGELERFLAAATEGKTA